MQYESARRETGHGISSSERTISLWRGRQRNKHQEVIALYLIVRKFVRFPFSNLFSRMILLFAKLFKTKKYISII